MAKKQPQPTDLELLKQHAEELWDRQQDVFALAAKVAKDAGRQGASFARDEVAPKVRTAYASGSDAVRGVADRVVPAVTGALGAAAALSDKSVRQALAGLGRLRGQAIPIVVQAPPAKRGISVGGWIGIGLGVVAAGAIAYAVWQTLRADDDLWIEDDVPELAAGE